MICSSCGHNTHTKSTFVVHNRDCKTEKQALTSTFVQIKCLNCGSVRLDGSYPSS